VDGSTPPFTIDAASGQISVSANKLDFETGPVYNLTIFATDNGVPALSANTSVVVVLRCVGWLLTAFTWRSINELWHADFSSFPGM
jgi:hypothetical protein